MQMTVTLSLILAALALVFCWPVPFSPALAQAALAQANEVAGMPPPSAGFQAFLQSLWPLAQQAGVTRATFDTALAGLEPDPALPAVSNQQAEFDKPLKSYLSEAVSVRRIARGRECLQAWRAELSTIEQRFGVPPQSSSRPTAWRRTLGSERRKRRYPVACDPCLFARDRPVFRDELIGALVMLDKSGIARTAMKGSWAGAMGGPQFLPSAFLKYAVSFAGRGAPDIWSNPLDSLASIANFLRQSGWQPGLPWGMEVILPEHFGFASLHQSLVPLPRRESKAPARLRFQKARQPCSFLPVRRVRPSSCLRITGCSRHITIRIPTRFRLRCWPIESKGTRSARPLAGARSLFKPDAKGGDTTLAGKTRALSWGNRWPLRAGFARCDP